GEDLQFALHRIGNGRQGARGRQHAIQLAPAMVGYHDPVGTEAYRIARVISVEDALDHHRSLPEFADPFQVLPADRRIEVAGQPADVIGQPGGTAAVSRYVAQ